MISYELAKKLKDAGFPQKGKGEFLESLNDECDVCGFHVAYIPTLSELIEALGKDLYSIQFTANIPGTTCYVLSSVSLNKGPVFSSNSPEESVALLWLALNKNI